MEGDPGSVTPRGARHRFRQRHQGRPLQRRHRRLRLSRQPQVRRFQTLPGETDRRRADLESRSPATSRTATSCGGWCSSTQCHKRPSFRGHAVRILRTWRRAWIELEGGLPTISFRDLAIQRRDNDLVGASFGRGFYVLDDYSPVALGHRQATERDATRSGSLGTVQIQRRAAQGSAYFLGGQPAFWRGLHVPPRRRPEHSQGPAARTTEKTRRGRKQTPLDVGYRDPQTPPARNRRWS